MKRTMVLIILLTSLSLNAKSIEETFPKLKKECNNRNFESCSKLGAMSYVDNPNIKKNLSKSFKYHGNSSLTKK
jgi:hypothetical protein